MIKMDSLIDKPSKAMGVYRALLYMILKARDVNTFSIDYEYSGVINQPIVRDFIDKYFISKPSEAKVTITINEVCNNILRIFKNDAYRRDSASTRISILEYIEDKFYEEFLDAFKYYLKIVIIPSNMRNIIRQFIEDCKSNLYMHINKLTQIGNSSS